MSFVQKMGAARERRAWELRHAVRLTVAALIAYVVGETLHLPQAYWSVFTAVLVSQSSLGGSVKAGGDWFLSTLGGGIYATIVSTLVPHEDPIIKGACLGAALLPLAFLAAIRPTFRFAPVTGVIIVLVAPITQLTPLEAATNRLLEIAVGGFIGIAVSIFVLPARASLLLNRQAARTLGTLADIFPVLLQFDARDEVAFQARHDAALVQCDKLNLAVDEARRERSSFLSGAPDPEPVLRTLRRLRADIIMLGRAVAEPFPETYHARLVPVLSAAVDAFQRSFREIGRSLEERAAPPSLAAVQAAVAGYEAEITVVREQGLTRGLSGDAVRRTFAVGFALEQLETNLTDLASRTAERAKKVTAV